MYTTREAEYKSFKKESGLVEQELYQRAILLLILF
jgi:hypothetical protein